jgi:hypothetical protein
MKTKAADYMYLVKFSRIARFGILSGIPAESTGKPFVESSDFISDSKQKHCKGKTEGNLKIDLRLKRNHIKKRWNENYSENYENGSVFIYKIHIFTP